MKTYLALQIWYFKLYAGSEANLERNGFVCHRKLLVSYCAYYKVFFYVNAIGSSTEKAELLNAVSQLVPFSVRVDIYKLFNPIREDNCIENVTDAQLVDKVVIQSREEEPANVDSGNDELKPLPSNKHQLQAVSLCKRFCGHYTVSDAVRSPVSALQREIRRHGAFTAQQSTLDAWLSIWTVFIRQGAHVSMKVQNRDNKQSTVQSQLWRLHCIRFS